MTQRCQEAQEEALAEVEGAQEPRLEAALRQGQAQLAGQPAQALCLQAALLQAPPAAQVAPALLEETRAAPARVLPAALLAAPAPLPQQEPALAPQG